MAILVRVRYPGTGEYADDADVVWDGHPIEYYSDLSARDLGCDPGTEFLVEMVDEDSTNVIDSLPVTAT